MEIITENEFYVKYERHPLLQHQKSTTHLESIILIIHNIALLLEMYKTHAILINITKIHAGNILPGSSCQQ